MVNCADSNRLWASCLTAARYYRDTLDNQIAAIAKHDLGFPKFERDLRSARRYFAVAKTAVVNHHNIHRC